MPSRDKSLSNVLSVLKLRPSRRFSTGFNTFINAEINGWSWFGPIDDCDYETSFTMRFGSKSFEGKKYAVFENAFEIELSRM